METTIKTSLEKLFEADFPIHYNGKIKVKRVYELDNWNLDVLFTLTTQSSYAQRQVGLSGFKLGINGIYIFDQAYCKPQARGPNPEQTFSPFLIGSFFRRANHIPKTILLAEFEIPEKPHLEIKKPLDFARLVEYIASCNTNKR